MFFWKHLRGAEDCIAIIMKNCFENDCDDLFYFVYFSKLLWFTIFLMKISTKIYEKSTISDSKIKIFFSKKCVACWSVQIIFDERSEHKDTQL